MVLGCMLSYDVYDKDLEKRVSVLVCFISVWRIQGPENRDSVMCFVCFTSIFCSIFIFRI